MRLAALLEAQVLARLLDLLAGARQLRGAIGRSGLGQHAAVARGLLAGGLRLSAEQRGAHEVGAAAPRTVGERVETAQRKDVSAAATAERARTYERPRTE